MKKKIGVVLLNMGGPDSLDAIQPFLYNLFSDHDIIQIPKPIQKPVAFLISRLRAKKTRKYYEIMGGKSPQKEQTLQQAEKLQSALGEDFKVVVAMRYWHPFTEEALQELFKEDLKGIVLLPLYPHYSRTTTGSSFNEFDRKVKKYIKSGKYTVLSTLKGVKNPYYYSSNIPIKKINCFFNNPDYINAMVTNIKENLPADYKDYYFLFSAHSLPEKIILDGDPYQKQTEETVRLIMQHFQGVKYSLAYQSKVGPVKWLEPFTDQEIERLAKEGVKKLVVIPVSFVSEHSETLYELDYQYGQLAKELGIESYIRIPTLKTHPLFIEALKNLVIKSLQG
ncbi:MAG: ferrochelatase [Sulfurihydrogenibium sp.]|jgi:ferrochelatase|uniref:ferrochelatase n=1 Tax=Sulfurihydrogenibium sp. TaxID=2053621 RepID=UPI000CBAA19C|nr:MAG: ferrochelatase [Sulfurihydrogenibium sp.]PMP63728.1 MAG: ferrochelatase [Sulfurihydrogenibium sp.]PMP77614.1 MAG: ferrochelatase [Sulfurihydrogenibium sp.]